jgi:putative hydrolase of the HAD superfamily
MPPIDAVGFDLGETLFTYADTPLDWAALYEPALLHVAAACRADEPRSTTPASSRNGDQRSRHVTPPEVAVAAAVLRQYNTRLNPRTVEHGAEDIFRAVFASWPVGSAAELPRAIEAFFGFFQQRLVPFPEAVAALTRLRSRGFRTGALTDTPYGMPREFVRRDLVAIGIEPLLDAWLTSVDVGWRKPHVAGFKALAAMLGSEVSRLCYVGNEEKDIRGARAAGATAVLIDREDRAPAWGQNATIRSLAELDAVLEAGAEI